jgi:uncharacterized membrane protein (DUF373 family)
MSEPAPADESPPGRARGVGPGHGFTLQRPIVAAESVLYVVIAGLLVLAAGCTFVATIIDLLRDSASRDVADLGLFVLERTLLVFMIAELLATLRLVDFGARILVEPFLLIAIIAVMRRVLVVTAEIEGNADHQQRIDFLWQLAALGGLTLALALALHLLRGARPTRLRR